MYLLSRTCIRTSPYDCKNSHRSRCEAIPPEGDRSFYYGSYSKDSSFVGIFVPLRYTFDCEKNGSLASSLRLFHVDSQLGVEAAVLWSFISTLYPSWARSLFFSARLPISWVSVASYTLWRPKIRELHESRRLFLGESSNNW